MTDLCLYQTNLFIEPSLNLRRASPELPLSRRGWTSTRGRPAQKIGQTTPNSAPFKMRSGGKWQKQKTISWSIFFVVVVVYVFFFSNYFYFLTSFLLLLLLLLLPIELIHKICRMVTSPTDHGTSYFRLWKTSWPDHSAHGIENFRPVWMVWSLLLGISVFSRDSCRNLETRSNLNLSRILYAVFDIRISHWLANHEKDTPAVLFVRKVKNNKTSLQ